MSLSLLMLKGHIYRIHCRFLILHEYFIQRLSRFASNCKIKKSQTLNLESARRIFPDFTHTFIPRI